MGLAQLVGSAWFLDYVPETGGADYAALEGGDVEGELSSCRSVLNRHVEKAETAQGVAELAMGRVL